LRQTKKVGFWPTLATALAAAFLVFNNSLPLHPMDLDAWLQEIIANSLESTVRHCSGAATVAATMGANGG
jgi:hypothetical protein